MKKGYKLIIVFLLSLIVASANNSLAQEYRTLEGGEWIENEEMWEIYHRVQGSWIWEDLNEALDPDFQNDVVIHIGNGDSYPEHIVTLSGSISGINDIVINIYKNSKLIIEEGLSVHTRFRVNVEEGATFIVNGNVTMHNGGGDQNKGILEINGDAEINGTLSGNGEVKGSGSLYVENVGDGITINPEDQDSVNVIGSPENYCKPTGLKAEIDYSNEKYSVILTWGFDTDNCAEPVGFEISRDGSIVHFLYFSAKSILSFQWTDSDPSLEASSEPIYEVRAVYENSIKSEPAVISFENNPLPIELLFFTAKVQEDIVNVEWATAAEINNDFFTIERSQDGNNWEIIGYEQGAGNNNHTLYYSFTDINPVDGVSYYRLKQTDFDGQFEYFAPVAVQFNKQTAKSEIIQVAAQGQRVNMLLSNQDHNATLVVANIQGRVLHTQSIQAAGYAQQVAVNLPAGSAGEIIIIRLNNGQTSHERKIVVR